MIIKSGDNSTTIILLKILFYLFLVMYFGYHILTGKYGILSYRDAGRTLIEKQNTLHKKEEYISKQKNKIERLNVKNIDMDLLDEKLRENVGLSDKNEIILFTKDLKNI